MARYEEGCTQAPIQTIEDKLRTLLAHLSDQGFDVVTGARRLADKLSSDPANCCDTTPAPFYSNDLHGLVDEVANIVRNQYTAIHESIERAHRAVGEFLPPPVAKCCEPAMPMTKPGLGRY